MGDRHDGTYYWLTLAVEDPNADRAGPQLDTEPIGATSLTIKHASVVRPLSDVDLERVAPRLCPLERDSPAAIRN